MIIIHPTEKGKNFLILDNTLTRRFNYLVGSLYDGTKTTNYQLLCQGVCDKKHCLAESAIANI